MKNLLFCATDAGGARNLSPLLSYVQSEGFTPILIASQETSVFFDSRGVKNIGPEDVNSEAAAVRILKETSPVAVVCGTTRYLSPERFLITAARRISIRSIALLDEWFNYYARFQKEGRLAYLPDIICCQDEQARQEAANEGIPVDRLSVTGSPALSILTFKAEKFLCEPPDLPVFIRDEVRPIIIFIHESHSVDYGSKPGESGRLGKFIGYTEQTVRQDIFDTLKKIGKSCTVIEKLHPAYSENKLTPLGDEVVKWITLPKADLWPLLWHSDLVIGMRSIALLESAILGCATVSYQPNLIGPQLCTAVRLKLIHGIESKDELYRWINGQFAAKPQRAGKFVKRFAFVKDNVLENITELISSNEKIKA
jgi:hypothetical protein